ncbi:ornithine carbamoyltransferase [Jannaschia aquimarina]|uniref:Ornithine carbamoyltransferase n=1 Tax=Jannaschia aquimarina TaxID=935700 RepID=A0A0D1D925_9RHOB|nr:ornithine carbamoyltransferase [Jannaschia aquimarina]KIT16408.1 Ornithine carbamoyltransferase [Jannaschia aquimarina]SNS91544.1 ornithine carbamoyltransferase [Jannaschia aquimarina]
MTHFLDIDATPRDDLRAMLTLAAEMKAARGNRPKGTPDDETPLEGRVVALIFEKPSTRTRISFDVGVRQMGGTTMVLSGADMQLGHGETIADTARVLSRYVDLIMIRTFGADIVEEMAANASVPVINGLTDSSHPCQIMADVMTYEEHRGPIAGARVAWMGDGNNVAQSFLQAAERFGFDFTFSGPAQLDPDERLMDALRRSGREMRIERDPARAVADADLIVTDTWVSMGDAESSRQRRHNLLRPYQVNARLMENAPQDAIVMHCLPAHRGEEITDEVMDGPRSVIFDEAENRLHAQKAIMRHCLGV